MTSRNLRLTAARRALRRPLIPHVVDPHDNYPTSYTLVSALGLVSGDPLLVPAGQHYKWDLATTPGTGLAQVTVAGKLSFDHTKDIELLTTNMEVTSTGRLEDGTAASPLPLARKHIITLNGAETTLAPGWVADCSNSAIKQLAASPVTPPAANQTITLTRLNSTSFKITSSTQGVLSESFSVGGTWNHTVFFKTTGDIGGTITITVSQKGQSNASNTRALIVQPGGQIVMHWAGSNKTQRVQLQGTPEAPSYAAGTTSFSLTATPVGWKADDEIGIGTTEFWEWGTGTNDISVCDRRALVSDVSSAAMTIKAAPGGSTAGLSRKRWAHLQYVSETGVDAYGRVTGELTLTDPGYTPHVATVPKVLDERAWVVNLTRGIVIQGANDTKWTSGAYQDNLGAHVMIMGNTSLVQLDGVEFRRVGQMGRHGRYPLHFHMNSYNMPNGMGLPSDGGFVGPMTDAYVRNCSIHTSKQHAVQLHGVHGVEVSNTVAFNIKGHAFNLEDGSERKNKFINCTAMDVEGLSPYDGNANVAFATGNLKQTKKHDGEAAGFWLTNPDNDVNGCVAVRCMVGVWLSTAERCWGLSRDVSMRPARLIHGELKNNYIMGTKEHGARTTREMGDELGNTVSGGFYWPDANEGSSNPVPFTLEAYQIYKAGGDSYLNRAGLPIYLNWITADAARTHFSGAVNNGFIDKSLLVRDTLNVANWRNYNRALLPKRGMASYHLTLVPRDCVFLGFYATFPNTSSTTSGSNASTYFNADSKIDNVEATGGAIGSDDLYMQSVEIGYVLATGNKFMSSAPTPFSRQWNFRQLLTGESRVGTSQAVGGVDTCIAAAKKDVHGWLGPAGNYVVWDHPYFTYGLSDAAAIPDDPYSKTTATKFYGGQFLGIANTYDGGGDTTSRRFSMAQTRYDNSWNEVAQWNLDSTNVSGAQFGLDKRFSAFAKGGRYKIITGTVGTYLRLRIDGANAADDEFIIGLSYPGATPGRVVCISGYPKDTKATGYSASEISQGVAAWHTEVASLSALVAYDGRAYWQDTANNLMWVKYRGGFPRRLGSVGGGWEDPTPWVPNTPETWQTPNSFFLVPKP